MTRPDFDPLLLDPTRLSIVSLLAATEWAEFGWVRDSVSMSDSALSKQVTTLSRQGYVETEKGYVGKRPRTWLNLSESGREALERHVSALQRIVEQSRQTAGSSEAADSGETGGTTGANGTGRGHDDTAERKATPSAPSAGRAARRSPPPAGA
ncbi:transcriptional regulator [Streptomyces sp. HNM0575]|uniref:winged helix-turn-helix domain-containing protein n=1 Tax=Streptomyces sp. HNM0575 TaxID=2716338 RepID=UPI00145D56E0|nr:transcriptional regulator [Streptomyces sp. HNM0575]NLU73759.1 transcriptional regulator [Streptomyces sp. HNM0575]